MTMRLQTFSEIVNGNDSVRKTALYINLLHDHQPHRIAAWANFWSKDW